MSRLIVDVTGEQHQYIKAMAAMKGKSIKDYVLEKVLPSDNSKDESAALSQLKELLEARIASAESNGASRKSVEQIINDTT